MLKKREKKIKEAVINAQHQRPTHPKLIPKRSPKQTQQQLRFTPSERYLHQNVKCVSVTSKNNRNFHQQVYSEEIQK